MNIKLSVVIPTKNRQAILKNLISSFVSQDIDYCTEFIIIDQTTNALDDNNLKLLNGIAENIYEKCYVKYLHLPDLSGLTQARNVGIVNSNGKIVLFLDDDVILLPEFMKGILEGFEKGFNGVSGVLFENTFDEGLIKELYTNIFFRGYIRDKRRAINRKFYKYEPYMRTNVLCGGITAYYKEVLTNNWFDENFIRYSLGEDKEFSMRISARGAKLAICTKSIAYHTKHPVGKPNLYKRYEGKTIYIKYLQYKFRRILKSKLTISTTWALFGTFIDAGINSVIKHSLEPIKGSISGIKKAKNGFKNLEFINIVDD